MAGSELDDLEKDAPAASGTQSLDRGLALLAAVAAQPVSGIGLPELTQEVGLSKPTTHRLLTGLRHAGLVDYDADRRRFFPGFRLYQLGQAASARFHVIQMAAPSLKRLADATGDTVYLSIRHGEHLNCVARSVGDFPIKMLTLNVGDVRPLGLGSNGLVLLAALPDAQCEAAILRHREALRKYPAFAPDALREMVARTRQQGYGFNEGLMLPEMSALAMGIRNPDGAVDASISVASITSRMQTPRRESVLALLRQEIEAIEQLMSAYQQVRP